MKQKQKQKQRRDEAIDEAIIGERFNAEEREQKLLEQMPQVRFIARRIHERLPQHVAIGDLINAGVVGLIDALNKYDDRKNVQFRSYAQFRIRGAILDSLRELDWSPRELRRKSREIETAIQKLSHQLGRMPQEPEVARELAMELCDFQLLLGDLRGLDLGSLTVESHEEGGSVDEDCNMTLAMDDEDGPYQQCLRAEMRTLLATAISELSEREQQVLSLYYFEELSMKEIGAVLGVVESRISQIHTAAIVKMRGVMRHKLESKPGVLVYASQQRGGQTWVRP